jgi:hypothetical protein
MSIDCDSGLKNRPISRGRTRSTVGSLLAMAAQQPTYVLLTGYISIPAVTATYGSALTVGHFEERNAARRKVTKRSCPWRSVPR